MKTAVLHLVAILLTVTASIQAAQPLAPGPATRGVPWASYSMTGIRGSLDAPGVVVASVAGLGGDEYLLDSQGREVGLVTWMDGTRLEVLVTQEGVVTAPGMWPATKVVSDDGRLAAVEGPQGVLVAFSYDSAGVVDQVDVPGVAKMGIQSMGEAGVRQELFSSSGEVIAESTTPQGFGALDTHLVNLDPVAIDLGLRPDWMQFVRAKWNDSGTAATLVDLDGNALLYLAVYGPVIVGFDLSGSAMFYDLDLSAELLGEGTSGQVPSRVFLTADGRVGIHTLAPQFEAVAGCWSSLDEDGSVLVHVRTVHAAAETTAAAGGLVVHAENLAICRSTTVCTYHEPDHTLWGCDYYFYWCEVGGGGGGCLDCGGGGTAGGGGGGGSSHYFLNRVPRQDIRATVDAAITRAVSKLANPTCAAVFSRFTNHVPPFSDNETAQDVLSRHNLSPQEWMTQRMIFYGGAGQARCQGSASYAFVPSPGSRIVRVCDNYLSLRPMPGEAANTLIHEALHTLGLGESPGHQNQPTSTQIAAAVREACGN